MRTRWRRMKKQCKKARWMRTRKKDLKNDGNEEETDDNKD